MYNVGIVSIELSCGHKTADQNVVTAGYEVVMKLLQGHQEQKNQKALYFASSSFPGQKTTYAAFLATALRFPIQSLVLDIIGGSRAGMAALYQAMSAVQHGVIQEGYIVVADDMPNASLLKAGACRVIDVSTYPISVSLVAFHSFQEAFHDVAYKEPLSPFDQLRVSGNLDESLVLMVRQAHHVALLNGKTVEQFILSPVEGSKHTSSSSHLRYVTTHVQPRLLADAISQALERASLKLKDISWFGCLGVDKKTVMRLSSMLHLSPARFFNDQISIPQGISDSVDIFIFLKYFIDTAQPGDFGLLTSVGNGADVLIIQKMKS